MTTHRGELPILVTVKPDPYDGKREMVGFRFKEPIAWFMLSVNDARTLARLILERADRAEKKNADKDEAHKETEA